MIARVLAVTGFVVFAACFAMGAVDHLHLHVPRFLTLYAVALVAYAIAARAVLRSTEVSRSALWVMAVVAVAARLALLPTQPDLSTDAYRYVWEGRVVLHGANPFALAPADSSLIPLRDSTFDLINHKPLTTIYPPLAQGLFALGAWVAPDVVALKGLFALLDLGIVLVLVALLRARGRPATHALIYAWSPLVIVETAHSGHLDAAGACFLVLGVTLLASGRRVWGGVALGASFLIKYLAIALVPFLLRRSPRIAVPAFIVIAVLGFVPFLDAGDGLTRSLRTYGFDWSFNGPPFMTLSMFMGDGAIARWVLMAIGAIAVVAISLRERDIVRVAFLVVGAAILLSPTVYPWYLVWIVPFLCVFPSRAWLLFTGSIALSYWVWIVHDATGAWMLPNWILALEYLPFYGLLLWDAMSEKPVASAAGGADGRTQARDY